MLSWASVSQNDNRVGKGDRTDSQGPLLKQLTAQGYAGVLFAPGGTSISWGLPDRNMSLKLQAYPRTLWDRDRIQGPKGLAWTLGIFTDLRSVTRGV